MFHLDDCHRCFTRPTQDLVFLGVNWRGVETYASMDPSTIPGLKPPPGVKPNFANPPDSYRVAGVVVVSLCLAFSTFFVAARLYTKVHVLPGKAGW